MTQPIATFSIATFDEEIYTPAIPGLEYTLKDNRLHYTLEKELGHYTLPENRLHYNLPEED